MRAGYTIIISVCRLESLHVRDGRMLEGRDFCGGDQDADRCGVDCRDDVNKGGQRKTYDIRMRLNL